MRTSVRSGSCARLLEGTGSILIAERCLWYFCMKAHIRVDAESGLVHTVRGSSGNVNDLDSHFSDLASLAPRFVEELAFFLDAL